VEGLGDVFGDLAGELRRFQRGIDFRRTVAVGAMAGAAGRGLLFAAAALPAGFPAAMETLARVAQASAASTCLIVIFLDSP
jgi:hypothetical protein